MRGIEERLIQMETGNQKKFEKKGQKKEQPGAGQLRCCSFFISIRERKKIAQNPAANVIAQTGSASPCGTPGKISATEPRRKPRMIK